MVFDISDFTLNEVIMACKENIENDYFKLRVSNKDYVLLINPVGVTGVTLTLFSRTNQNSDNNPIEHEIKEYEKQMTELLSIDLEDLNVSPSLTRALVKYNYKLSELNERAVDFIKRLHFNEELTALITERISYKTLDNPLSDFDKKFSKFFYELCCKRVTNDEKLQKELIELHERNEKKRKELEEHKKLIRENEKENQRKMEEFEKELGSYERKNSSSYNIRW